jgi:hypothetical protein
MTIVYNHDIVGIYDRFNRAIFETLHSASSGVTGYSESDLKRQEQYTGDLDSFHEHVVNEPKLDLVETHPKSFTLREPPVVTHVENPASNDLVRLYVIARDELINSQSSRLASNLIEFDSERLKDNTQKIKNLIEYIKDVQPIDLPESSPKEPLKGKGRTGV